jgi:hypothetical protein
MLHWLMEQLRSVGDWVVELVVAIAVCAAAYPVIRVGSMWRLFFRLGDKRYPRAARRRPLTYATVGAALLVTIGVGLYAIDLHDWAIGYSIIIACLIVLGWFGFVLVPEALEDAFD